MAKKFLTDINIAAGVYDSSGDIGNSGQVLSSTGSGVNWINATSSASIIYQDGFTGDGSTTAFTLANSIDNENKTQVYIDGVYQHKDNYSLSGTTLTFSTAPPNSSDIEVISFSSVSAADDILYDTDFASAGLMTTNGSGVYSITTNNSANWNTAYGWGDHGLSAQDKTDIGNLSGTNTGDQDLSSYATQSYVGTQITNLVDSSPATLNTLNELAAALGDDPNFATTTATNIGLKAPLASPSFTGNATFAGSISAGGISITTLTAANIQLNGSFTVLNKAQTSYLPFATRNTTGSEVVYDLTNAGNATFAGQVNITSAGSAHFGITNTNVSGSSQQWLQYVGSNGDYVFRDATDSRSPLILHGDGDATFAGTINSGTITSTGIVKAATTFLATSGDMTFFVNNVGEAMRIQQNTGNIGIGTTGPSSKLHVTGAPANGVYLSYLYNSGTHNSSHGLNVQTAANNIATYGLRVNTGGDSNTLAVMGNGSVGIGTASPIGKLTVQGDDADIYLRSNDYTIARIINRGSSGQNLDTGLFSLMYSNTENVRIDAGGNSWFNGGNVGIGTTTPGNLLDVAGDTDISGQLFVQHSGSYTAKLKQLATSMSNATYTFEIDSTAHTSNLSTAGAMSVDVDSGRAFTINGLGNVGIGTTGPGSKLDVQSSGVIARFTSSSNEVPVTIFHTSNPRSTIGFEGSTSVNDYSVRVGADGNDFIAYTNNIERMRINSSGNVGIGTTSPDSPLEIQNVPNQGANKMMLHLDANHTGNQGSAFLRISAGSNSAANTKIETVTSGGQGLFGTYVDTNIINSATSSGAYGNINFITGSSTSASSIVMTIGGGSQKGNVGIGEASPKAKIEVVEVSGTSAFNQSNNGAKIGRVQYGWYTGKNFNNNTAFTHIKTNLWMGGAPAGNTQYIMGGFTAKSYSYSGAGGYGEGSCMFHNWSGGFPNLSVTNRGSWATFMQSPYTSTDGYCVIVLRHNYYSTPNIDFHQEFTGYPWRQVSVTAQGQSSSATGVY